MEKKLRVGILGATGMVGQRFISLLDNHPWFEVVTVAASPRSAGKTYEEAVGGRWKMTTPMPEGVKKLIVHNVNEVEEVAATVDFVFSAVDMTKDEIRAIEEAYAKTETPVVSNNSAHRWTPDVPMVVPEINSQHFEVIADQKKRLGTTRGFIAVKPNCSIQSYAPCLAAWKEFGPKEVVATTYQAISGAGKTFKDWPEMVENIIPYIGGEEEKSEQEPLRVLGKVENGEIVKAELPKITCQCIRVPVLNGHTAAVFINFEKKPTKEQLIEKLVNFKGFPQEAELPSAPKQFIQHFEVIADQKKRLGTTRGFIAVKPNCSIQSYAPCLAAWKEFGPKEVVATTYQAISGAGKTFKDWPEMVENIIPYIGGEEEKSEQEPLRVLGKVENGEIVKAELPKITCQCIRVPVLNGHTAAVFINFEKKPTKEQLIEKLVNFKGFPQEAELPSAPKQFIQYLEEDNRPQVTLDVDYENGMGVSIGRLREDTMFDFKFVGLSHNTVRGAAGGAVLCAEALTAKGYIEAK